MLRTPITYNETEGFSTLLEGAAGGLLLYELRALLLYRARRQTALQTRTGGRGDVRTDC